MAMARSRKAAAQGRDRRAVACLLALPFAYSAVVVPLSAWEQAEVSLAMIGFAMLASLSRPLRPLIVFLSGFASLRYFYWRVTSTLNLDGPLDASVSILLLGAEVYGVAGPLPRLLPDHRAGAEVPGAAPQPSERGRLHPDATTSRSRS